jgi:hypothetical protein
MVACVVLFAIYTLANGVLLAGLAKRVRELEADRRELRDHMARTEESLTRSEEWLAKICAAVATRGPLPWGEAIPAVGVYLATAARRQVAHVSTTEEATHAADDDDRSNGTGPLPRVPSDDG